MPANATINANNCSLLGKKKLPRWAAKKRTFTVSQFYFEPPTAQTCEGSVNLYLNIYKYVYKIDRNLSKHGSAPSKNKL